LQVLLHALGRFGRRRATERASSCCTEVDEEGDFDGDGDLSNEKNQLRDRVRREDSKKRTCGGGRAGEIILRALLDTSLAVVSYLL
jgi:hypothetical protein